MLIDEFMPHFDAVERHRTVVNAPAASVYGALRTVNLADAWPVRALLAMRGLPAALAQGRQGLRLLKTRARHHVGLADFEEQGFRILAEDSPRELLIGLEGAFWRPSGNINPVEAASFRGPIPPGTARAAWNFHIEDLGGGTCNLSTETRVHCADAASRRSFRLYWLPVRPFSGLIRRLMLRTIRRHAERMAGALHT
jgi:hypothetical protein